MNMDEEEYDAYAYGGGCGIHGEAFLSECTLCGTEYCSACFRHSTLCADCAAQAAFADDEEAEPTEEEKDVLLADQFNDDEPPELIRDPAPVLVPKKTKVKKSASSKPKAAPKVKAKAKAKRTVTPSSKSKVKAKTKAKPKAKAKAKSKAKSSKSVAKKRKA